MGLFRRAARRVLDKVAGERSERAAAPPPAPSVAPAAAEQFNSLEAGAQEVIERVGAGEPVVLLDVRGPGETHGGRIPGALSIPLDELQVRWEELSEADEVVCYCQTGPKGRRAARILRERGLFNATGLEGGLDAWRDAGGEVVQ